MERSLLKLVPFDLHGDPSNDEQPPPSVVRLRMSPDRPGPEVEGPMSIWVIESGSEIGEE